MYVSYLYVARSQASVINIVQLLNVTNSQFSPCDRDVAPPRYRSGACVLDDWMRSWLLFVLSPISVLAFGAF